VGEKMVKIEEDKTYVEIDIAKETHIAEVDGVMVLIDGAEEKFEDIPAYIKFVIKTAFLQKYDSSIDLTQLDYIIAKTPESVHWNTIDCYMCKKTIEFTEEDIPNLQFVEQEGVLGLPQVY
jgi:hypothetical protein